MHPPRHQRCRAIAAVLCMPQFLGEYILSDQTGADRATLCEGDICCGSKAPFWPCAVHFRSTPGSRRTRSRRAVRKVPLAMFVRGDVFNRHWQISHITEQAPSVPVAEDAARREPPRPSPLITRPAEVSRGGPTRIGL
jgi:hypothetical protein